MRKRLFIYTTLIISAALLCFFAVAAYSTYANNLRIAEDTVVETANICAKLYNEETGLNSFAGIGSDIRVTVVASDGTVLADTRAYTVESAGSHLDRPEIIAAANDMPETHTRYSSTLGINLLYYALKVDINGGDYVFIRTAIPIEKIDSYLSRSMPLLVLTFCVIIVLCLVLSNRAIDRITKPLEAVKMKLSQLAEGKYSQTPLSVNFVELDEIVLEIDDVAQLLQENMKAKEEEKNKAEYILNNISDAIFAVNNWKDIALINNAALGIFGVTGDIIGKNINYLTYNETLQGAIGDCIESGKSTLEEFSEAGRTYILTVKRLENTALTMAILSDITDSRENAKQREEFFDNASHELKTPLTAIKGFNELCMLGNKDESIKKYIDSIARETDRMLSLIGDMLRLSELTNTQGTNPVPVYLHSVAAEIQDTLSGKISEKALEFEIAGECIIAAEQEHAYELLKNLIENAVRYNTDGGSVTVELSEKRLKVSDTGIGIPVDAQTRLFERFYRVEKSRSIQSGGTGLGLSIVKHICALYSWGLSLKSVPGIGTEVTVTF